MIAIDFFTGKIQWVPAKPGPIGPAGPGIDTADIATTMDIPALSLITVNGQVANSANLAHFNRVVGIVMTTVLFGFIATAVVEGEVTDSSWTWTPSYKLFLNGTTLSATPPGSGFSQLIAITRSAQTIFIRLQPPILL